MNGGCIADPFPFQHVSGLAGRGADLDVKALFDQQVVQGHEQHAFPGPGVSANGLDLSFIHQGHDALQNVVLLFR